MDKKIFGLLIALMALSLLGIIFVQWYWISNSYKNQESLFINNARQALLTTASKIERREIEDYYKIYDRIIRESDQPDSLNLNEVVSKINLAVGNDIIMLDDGINSDDYEFETNDLEGVNDVVLLKKVEESSQNNDKIDSEIVEEPKDEFGQLNEFKRIQYERAFANISSGTPIHKRVTNEEIASVITQELKSRGIESKFQFAVYSNNMATKVRTKKFDLNPESTFKVPLFDKNGNQGFQLYVNFYEQDKVVLTSILGMTILSLAFTSVIFIAFYGALSQLIKQRQLAQIKNDFINNMTHEFKTPIATINLALDALKNPKVQGDKAFYDRYMKMIRDENHRMHGHVENVLRISKLDKNELDLPKEKHDLHELIHEATMHISLIVEERGGTIGTHLGALKTDVLVNESHFTNVLVNILDNAVKYSEEAPKIQIYTENVRNTIVLKIRDNGIGMSKSAQKKVFEKFYRVPTGDIHNVKGQGLGLSYVKQILNDHDAKISVESDQGKGSTFIIKLHLIS